MRTEGTDNSDVMWAQCDTRMEGTRSDVTWTQHDTRPCHSMTRGQRGQIEVMSHGWRGQITVMSCGLTVPQGHVTL